MTRHFTIPVFVPEMACPFRCVFCNQYKITGKQVLPSPEKVEKIIKDHLATFPPGPRHVEVGFFGGSFTGISIREQELYLDTVKPFLSRSDVHGIRLSTRPDYITREILDFLKGHDVTTIELGAQSMDDEVLQRSARGHTSKDTVGASALIRSYGFSLGLQMMLGLPGDTKKKALNTAREIVALGADNTRIYPTIVIKGTKLEEWYRDGSYRPLSMEEAIEQAGEVVKVFECSGVRVLRVGLHPSEGLLSGKDLVAGPFHPAFREIVETKLWWDIMKQILEGANIADKVEIFVPVRHLNAAIGHRSENRSKLGRKFKTVIFKTDPLLKDREYRAVYH